MRLTLADDSVLLREGLARLAREAGFEVIAQVGDPEALLAAVRSDPPDVAVVDIRMPPTHTTEGLVAARRIRNDHPQVGVLVLSQYLETHYALELVSAGAKGVGYLLKDRVSQIDELANAIRRVAGGGTAIDPLIVSRLMQRKRELSPLESLTPREREVLGAMAEGRSNQAICRLLFVTNKTLEVHVRNIFDKLGLAQTADDHRRVLAVLAYLRD